MKEKLDISEDVIKQILKAGTYQECWDIFKDALPGVWPRVHPSQLPDAVNRHLVAVWKRGAGDLYDPPADPKGFSR